MVRGCLDIATINHFKHAPNRKAGITCVTHGSQEPLHDRSGRAHHLIRSARARFARSRMDSPLAADQAIQNALTKPLDLLVQRQRELAIWDKPTKADSWPGWHRSDHREKGDSGRDPAGNREKMKGSKNGGEFWSQ